MNGFEFCKKHDLVVDVPYKVWKDTLFDSVDIAFSESYIPTQKSTYCLRLSWVLMHFNELLDGRYKREDLKKHTEKRNYGGGNLREQWNSQEGIESIRRLNESFGNIKPEDL